MIDRREALKMLLAVGLGSSFKIELSSASEAEVVATHAKAMLSPETLYVNEFGTILTSSDDDYTMPTWREAFDMGEIKTVKDVMSEASQCWELGSRLDDWIQDIEDDRENPSEDSSDTLAEVDMNDLDSTLTEDEKSYLVSQANYWVDEKIEDPESLPRGATPSGQAYEEFQSWDSDVLDRVGIQLVEGDHPGSSFFGAVIYEDLDEVNETLQYMGIPLRFEEE